VYVNGVALVPYGFPGPKRFWEVDPSGPQPALGPAGYLAVTVKAGSLVRTVPLPCPADLAVTSSAPLGKSLKGTPSLQLSWPEELLVNRENPFPADYYANAKLRAFDVASRSLVGIEAASKHLPLGSRDVSLEVAPTAASGYLAELRWQGAYTDDAGSRGFCGWAKRIAYSN
jgi:hypothetical protein